MRTPLSYSSLSNRARPIPPTFCTGGHDCSVFASASRESAGRAILPRVLRERDGDFDSPDLTVWIPGCPTSREVGISTPSAPHPAWSAPPQFSPTTAPPHPRATFSPPTETAPATAPNISPLQSSPREKSPPDETPAT